MRARVTRFEIQQGKLDEAMAIITGEIAEAVRRQPGYVGMDVLSDPAESRGLVITYWNSPADLDALDARGFWESQVAHGIFLIASVPKREDYAVDLKE